MRFSHSKLNCVLNCPMTYYLIHKLKIYKKVSKPALNIGSAVHWGIEHEIDDTTEYFNNLKSMTLSSSWSYEQMQADAMLYAYFKYKDEIFDKLLVDENGQKLQMLEESHELDLIAPLKTFLQNHEDHEFHGILDLLIKTNKGYVLIDYKTSSMIPDYNQYLEQIYRYVYLVKSVFPDVPIYKIGIINLRKKYIRRLPSENDESYFRRLKREYDLDETLVNSFAFDNDKLDETKIKQYLLNLSRDCDAATVVIENGCWRCNYAGLESKYGKSDYYELLMSEDNCHVFYCIEDDYWSEDNGKFETIRDCNELDMIKCFDVEDLIICKYEKFEQILLEYLAKHKFDRDEFLKYLLSKYLIDSKLFDTYLLTFDKKRVKS